MNFAECSKLFSFTLFVTLAAGCSDGSNNDGSPQLAATSSDQSLMVSTVTGQANARSGFGLDGTETRDLA